MINCSLILALLFYFKVHALTHKISEPRHNNMLVCPTIYIRHLSYLPATTTNGTDIKNFYQSTQKQFIQEKEKKEQEVNDDLGLCFMAIFMCFW